MLELGEFSSMLGATLVKRDCLGGGVVWKSGNGLLPHY